MQGPNNNIVYFALYTVLGWCVGGLVGWLCANSPVRKLNGAMGAATTYLQAHPVVAAGRVRKT